MGIHLLAIVVHIFSCLLGDRNFKLSSLIFTKSSGFLDPYRTKSLRKVKQSGEAEIINFL